MEKRISKYIKGDKERFNEFNWNYLLINYEFSDEFLKKHFKWFTAAQKKINI